MNFPVKNPLTFIHNKKGLSWTSFLELEKSCKCSFLALFADRNNAIHKIETQRYFNQENKHKTKSE